jgi:transposase
VSRRTATINQIRAFLIEQGIAVRSGPRALRQSLFGILEHREDEISPRTAKPIRGLYEDWCCLDARIEIITGEIEELSQAEAKCRRLRSVPGIGPLISTAIVAAIGTGEAFDRGRDFAAWLGLVPRQHSHRWSVDPRPHLKARQQVPAHPVDPGGEGPADAAAQLVPL